MAAIQGIDLDKETGNGTNGVDEFERIKTEAFSHGRTSDPNDIMSLQGLNAEQAGFGIGMGIDAMIVDESSSANPLG